LPPVTYLPALDGVRGIAVAAVLLFHGGHLAGGFLGVDLFFVLSGFLITKLLLAEGGAGRIRLAHFWARRARRLFPALGATLFGVALYAALFASPEERAGIRADAWATMLYVPNWRAVFAGSDYWALFRTPSPLQHTWSLGIEEQFYGVWPLALAAVFAVCGRRTPLAVCAGSLGLAAASIAAMWLLYDPRDPSRVYFGTDTRAAAILFGGALAAWQAGVPRSRSRAVRTAIELTGALGALVLGAAWWTLDGDAPALYRGGFVACGLAGAALIAAAVHPQRGPLAAVLALAPLRGLGIISYGVYLWHWPVYLVLDAERTGLSGWALFAVRVVATLAISFASYRWIERPIRGGGGAARPGARPAPAAPAAIALAIAAGTAGARSSAPPLEMAGAQPTETLPAPRPPTGNGATRVLVVGDSVAVSLFPGLVHAAGSDFDFTIGVKMGCDRKNPAPDCPPSWPVQVAQQQPDVVLIAETGFWSLVPIEVGARVISMGTPEWDEHWTRERATLVDELLDAGAAQVVFTTLPCFSPEWWWRFPRLAPRILARANENLAAVATRRPAHVALVDLAGFVCPGGLFQAGIGPVAQLRVDGLHYSDEGSDWVGRWLVARLAGLGRSESGR
jgi:peptidoglycan/LPS O-acetylase OafA/YrhL